MSGVTTAPAQTTREADALVAIAVKALQAAGNSDEARERFGELVGRHQRRAARIAFHYLRDAADADEAVQDAFVKAYMHMGTFREELPFEVWFTRILINGCLDRLKARRRREKWLAPPVIDATTGVERDPAEYLPSKAPSP
jgi:RNA polymerase sigma-70 factor (ECF subfamily)